MRYILGIKFGGLQQKIFNLVLIFIIALVGVYVTVSVVMQSQLSNVVEEAGREQQAAIVNVSELTMKQTIAATMKKTTALQAYIADDLFSDVRSDVLTLQSLATEIYEHADAFPAHPFSPPIKANNGIASVQMQHETGVDPYKSASLGLAANMSEIMLSMFESSERLSSCFVATADGCILFVDDRAGSYFDENGEVYDFEVRDRPWYKQAVAAGRLIFTGVESDAFTDIAGLVCAAPIYRDGELVAVVGADIFLTAISDYVKDTASYGGFVCVVNQNGQVLFSPNTEGTFKPELSADAPDLRQSDNLDLSRFINKALTTTTGMATITVDDTEYYMVGSPMPTVGWAVLSAVDKAITHQPTDQMLKSYADISQNALDTYQDNAAHAGRTIIIITIVILLLATVGALFVASRVVKPIEHMTRRINSLSGEDTAFEMEKIYRTGDEIEILAESFAALSGKTREYIRQITTITAEKERIGTELALATRIQADMLPNIYPAFPDRPEFDIYASMDPAREVGGDFYDFFLVDDDHLCMLIADVSGKGVPAALFMMASRIILASNAKQGLSPAEILARTNETICQNNREEMFVTVWLGILEISTGKLTAANAGHEYPVLMQAGETFELVKDKHGFVIGGMDGMRYKEYELLLKPGAKLFLYTDGVPEATNAGSELFGTERMLAALNDNTGAAPQELLHQVRRAVDDFVQDAEQFDDLTMLGLEYKGNDDPPADRA
ncbi:MAG: SpoIIE family protein phosphatase [Acutalibacteraceae bacterium]|jgi:sigma-B regulation protein RsbU (phosphoserine phosphatase)